MKKTILILTTALLGVVFTTKAQTIVDGISVSSLKMERNGQYMVVDMLLDMSQLSVGGNYAVLLTPRLTNGTDSLDLPSVGIYGRRRYFYYLRNDENMLSGPEETVFKASAKPDSMTYHSILPYADWMNGADLSLLRSKWGCCNSMIDLQAGMLGHHTEQEPVTEFFPTLIYVTPQAETVKSRSLEGSAYIDFPVDKTVIHPDYRRNSAELAKIQATIDSVRYDSDVTITSVWLKGYASPESPYAHNKELAIGRTAALKKYIQQLYKFDNDLIITDFEPEDWGGGPAF